MKCNSKTQNMNYTILNSPDIALRTALCYSTITDKMATIIAICAGGLEDIVISDVLKHVSLGALVRRLERSKSISYSVDIDGAWVDKGEAGCGKLLIENVTDPSFIHKVRSVQHWLVYLARSTSLPLTADAGVRHIIGAATTGVDFDSSVKVWNRCLSVDLAEKYSDLVNGSRSPTFCVRCIRDGEHEYSSLDVSRLLGEAIIEKTSWSVDLRNMDIEIIAFIFAETLLLGINIPTQSPSFLKSRLPGEIRPPVVPSGLTSGLRPSTAYLLVQLAKPEVGDILVDGMCGCGSTFVEAAYNHSVVALGGDVDQDLQHTLKQSLAQTTELSKHKALAEVRRPYWLDVLLGSAVVPHYDTHGILQPGRNNNLRMFPLSWPGGVLPSCRCGTAWWTL
jgi:hypothetical protein